MSADQITRPRAAQLRAALPAVVVLALAVGYLGIGLVEEVAEVVPGGVSPVVHAALVALQAVALLFRFRAPVRAFWLIVLLDAVLLASSGGELGMGSLAVMIATYTLVRGGPSRAGYRTVLAAAVGTTVIGTVALVVSSALPPLVILVVVVARPILQYGAPAALAEFLLARERLVQALRDRAEFAERERRRDLEQEILAVRTAMARELHDIAAHHLSGIIVGAQAASALAATDPARTRDMLRTVQQDARTTLADLRRTVGLLRSDDDADDLGGTASPTPFPALERIPALVDSARSHGQRVQLTVTGDPHQFGPLAETAGYRMVQESLANAAGHAPGAHCTVDVEYLPELVRITVYNSAPANAPAALSPGRRHPGYGIAGMEERADLVGGRLTTGPKPDGGWCNRLEIPLERNRSTP